MNTPLDTSPSAMAVMVPGLKDNMLAVYKVQGHEALGRLYEYQIELANLSEPEAVRQGLDPEGILQPQTLLGKTLTIRLPLANDKARYFSGIVTRACRLQSPDGYSHYGVTISPELWLLTLNRDCRIFQDMTVPEVVKQILRQHKISSFRESLFHEYRQWDCVTQYRESDFEFISRILAHEGIYYYFEHSEDGHTLVLADSVSSHGARQDFEAVWMGRPSSSSSSPDYLETFQDAFEIQSNTVILADFDFRLRGPSAKLSVRQHAEVEAKCAGLAIYDYPGKLALAENQDDPPDNAAADECQEERERLAQTRLAEKRCQAERYRGQGTARWLTTGFLFSIDNSEAYAQRQFLATMTEITLRNSLFRSGNDPVGEPCEITVTAIDSQTQFRSPRLEKPVARGPQTAQVVGPKNEEIWTDRYGRIKLQFHWDRKGVCDENSSCWVRVAHPWAGNRWGAIHVPRVGNEVVVEFLEGDPDRPLVTGSVYNADNMPPYTLPENKTQSGIKSRSSKGGTEANFNEIRLEDKKGHEELHIQAERNMSTLVKHDQSLTVQADRKVTVHGASMATYQGGRSETVQNGDTLTVERSDKTTMVGGEYNIVAVKHYNVSSGESAVCDVDLKEGVATITAAKEIDLVCGDASLSLKKDGLATITAAKEIKLECGEASLSLKSDGTVTIQGKKTLSATGAEAKLELAAAGAKLSGQNATVSGKTMTEISGGMVKIN
ncbi:MAG: type VI secretion system tip protein TssI/VgrG [Polyangia bacterium]|jgi:type VI secretion system secreted protein VgrG